MKSRAELADEPRTMQFLIERPCLEENANPSQGRVKQVEGGFLVWVHIEKRAPTYEDRCSGIHYRLTDESHRHANCKPTTFVCEHMGHLLE